MTSPEIKHTVLPFFSLMFALGFNRPAADPDPDANYYFQANPAGSTSKFEGSVYTLEQVSDSGPFNNVWFVSNGNFTLQRVRLVNEKLYPGGVVYDLNAGVSPAQQALVDRLRKTVERHEEIHSDLMRTTLANMRQQDPAYQLEKAVGEERGKLAERLDSAIAGANSALIEGTAEDKVKNEVRRLLGARPGGTIYYLEGSQRASKDLSAF